jgi:hypothetical protein
MIPILLRGMLPRIALVALLGVAFYYLEPGLHRHEVEAPEDFLLDLGALGLSATLANYAGLAMLVLLGGFISDDRRRGYSRLYFSHPTRPAALYGVRWLLALAVAMVAATLFLILGQLAGWGGFEGGWSGLQIAFVAAVAYGGLIAFLSAVMRRGDLWLALVLFVFNYFWLQAVALGAQPLPGFLNRLVPLLLPPQLALSDVYDGILRGEVAWAAATYAVGYGVFWLTAAGVALRVREWP